MHPIDLKRGARRCFWQRFNDISSFIPGLYFSLFRKCHDNLFVASATELERGALCIFIESEVGCSVIHAEECFSFATFPVAQMSVSFYGKAATWATCEGIYEHIYSSVGNLQTRRSRLAAETLYCETTTWTSCRCFIGNVHGYVAAFVDGKEWVSIAILHLENGSIFLCGVTPNQGRIGCIECVGSCHHLNGSA